MKIEICALAEKKKRKRGIAMKRVYLDNGSTSYPKAPGVGQAVCDFIEHIGTNVNRGGYQEAYAAEDVIIETREKLCRLFNLKMLSSPRPSPIRSTTSSRAICGRATMCWFPRWSTTP